MSARKRARRWPAGAAVAQHMVRCWRARCRSRLVEVTLNVDEGRSTTVCLRCGQIDSLVCPAFLTPLTPLARALLAAGVSP